MARRKRHGCRHCTCLAARVKCAGLWWLRTRNGDQEAAPSLSDQIWRIWSNQLWTALWTGLMWQLRNWSSLDGVLVVIWSPSPRKEVSSSCTDSRCWCLQFWPRTSQSATIVSAIPNPPPLGYRSNYSTKASPSSTNPSSTAEYFIKAMRWIEDYCQKACKVQKSR